MMGRATHNLTLTWDSTTGHLKLYDNNQLLATKSASLGRTIPVDGWLVIGQEQDAYGGGFDGNQALTNAEIGHITLAYDVIGQADIEAGMSVSEASSNLAIDLKAVNGAIVDVANDASFTTLGSVTTTKDHYEFTPNEGFNGDVTVNYELSDGALTTSAGATLSVGQANATLNGTDGRDMLIGYDGSNSIIGGAGNDILTGGDGSDTFIWHASDVGTAEAPSEDTITDFSLGQGGDVIDLSDVLDEADPLDSHLSLNFDNGDTTIEVKPEADGNVIQKIKLEGVDLSGYGGGTTDAEILNNLIGDGNLQVD